MSRVLKHKLASIQVDPDIVLFMMKSVMDNVKALPIQDCLKKYESHVRWLIILTEAFNDEFEFAPVGTKSAQVQPPRDPSWVSERYIYSARNWSPLLFGLFVGKHGWHIKLMSTLHKCEVTLRTTDDGQVEALIQGPRSQTLRMDRALKEHLALVVKKKQRVRLHF